MNISTMALTRRQAAPVGPEYLQNTALQLLNMFLDSILKRCLVTVKLYFADQEHVADCYFIMLSCVTVG